MWQRLNLEDYEKEIKVAHVCTFGEKCGISIYLENLLNYIIPLNRKIEHVVFGADIPDGDDGNLSLHNSPRVIRAWSKGKNLDKLISEIRKYNPDILHIQHEWSFFPVYSKLYKLLLETKKLGITNIITWHTVLRRKDIFYDPLAIATFLEYIDPLVDLHTIFTTECIDILKSWGISRSKMKHIPSPAFPVMNIPKLDAREKMLSEKYWNKKLVLTTGFSAPHKGIPGVIDAISLINDNITLLCIGSRHPLLNSNYSYENHASQKNVDMFLDGRFVSDEDLSNYLACADIIVMNYQFSPAGTSAAGRRAISSKRAVIVSDVSLFQDLEDGVNCLKVPPNNPKALSIAIKSLLNNEDLNSKLVSNATSYAERISHKRVAEIHVKMYELFRK